MKLSASCVLLMVSLPGSLAKKQTRCLSNDQCGNYESCKSGKCWPCGEPFTACCPDEKPHPCRSSYCGETCGMKSFQCNEDRVCEPACGTLLLPCCEGEKCDGDDACGSGGTMCDTSQGSPTFGRCVPPPQEAKVLVRGTDAIYLAGRTDIMIPPAHESWNFLLRHGAKTPEELQETFPPFLCIKGGDVLRVPRASGGISYYNGLEPVFTPSGNGASGSSLSSLGGISGYIGPQGSLVGVFLDDSIPSSGPPAAYDFTSTGIGTNFLSLTPALGQVFYIGDGFNSNGDLQAFIAPAGATRVFFGIPDGFGFRGRPAAYDDNDGIFDLTVSIN